MTGRERYRPIHDYGLIGDGRTAALVSSTGSVDWWCLPRFDGPSVFARLLDLQRGGHFRVRPIDRHTRTVTYEDDTNVLRTAYQTENGAVEMLDFMPSPTPEGAASRLVRVLQGTRGEVDLRLTFAPRFDYGRVRPGFRVTGDGAVAEAEGHRLALHTDADLEETETGIVGTVRAREGARRAVVAEPDVEPSAISVEQAVEWLEDTRSYWRDWAARCTYEGPHRDAVVRSTLVLKLLQHASSGAFLAAPTTSLPEEIGGVRNWDYRYVWSRDAAFAVAALHEVGHGEEAYSFADWVARHLRDTRGGQLSILLDLDGEPPGGERTLDHLEGYRGSRPVRVGNAAVRQRQLDVYGETMDGLHLCHLLGKSHIELEWPSIRELVDHVAGTWRKPDQGIWEVRGPPKHFVHSKVMAWTAFDRGIRAAEDCGLDAPIDRWRREREAVHAEVLERGYDSQVDAFVQAYGQPMLDAANLMIPLVGFLPPDDPRVEATVDRTLEGLTSNGLVYRYLATDDGLPGGEASFTACTFWLIEALAEMGRTAEARDLLDNVCARASPLGLFAEELDPVTGEHLGNYPQALPHLALLEACVALERAERGETECSPRARLNRRSSRARPSSPQSR